MSRAAPFAPLLIAFAGGIWFSSQFPPASYALALIAAGALIALRLGVGWPAALSMVAALGGLRLLLAAPDASAEALRALTDKPVVIEGVIDDDPDARPAFTYLRVRSRTVTVEAADATGLALPPRAEPNGLILVRTDSSARWRYGDVIRLSGTLEAAPVLGDFDYRDYLARKGILVWMPRPERLTRLAGEGGSPVLALLMRARTALRSAAQRSMPSPESALLTGILIGDDNELPPEIQEAFRRTGTSHIVAISGFNVSIVIALVVPALSRLLNRRRAALVAIPAIAAYAALVGGSASVLRAAAMAILGLIGQLLWRRGFTVNTLCAGAFALLVGDPWLLFDGGYQLSCAATLGLALYSEGAQRRTAQVVLRRVGEGPARRVALAAFEPLLTTLAAQVTTLPLLLTNFHQLSLALPLTNTLVLPLQSAAMILGLLAAAVGVLSEALARWVALPAYALLTLTLRVVEATARLPLAALPVYGIETPAALGYALFLASTTALAAQPAGWRARLRDWLRAHARGGTIALTALIGVVLAAVLLLQRPDGRLHVTLAGTGALIQTPGGRQIVYGGGGALLPAVGRAMPLFDREIDVLILPERSDTARGQALPVLERYRVAALIAPAASAPDEPTGMLDDWQAAAQLSAAERRDVPVGTRIEVEPGLTLTLLSRAPGGLRLLVEHGEAVFDLSGSGDPTDGPRPPNALVYAAGRSRAILQVLAREPPRWLVWADAGAVPPAGAPAAYRPIRLRELGTAEFVSDGRTVLRVR